LYNLSLSWNLYALLQVLPAMHQVISGTPARETAESAQSALLHLLSKTAELLLLLLSAQVLPAMDQVIAEISRLANQ
jgi:hypothetical protein